MTTEDQKDFLHTINQKYDEFKLTEDDREPVKKDMFKFQQFIRAYLDNDNYNRGLLVYHGLGSGKTCTSIIVAENLKTHRNILVLTPGIGIRSNFKESLKTGECFTTNYKNNKNINKQFKFITSKAVNTARELQKLGSLDEYLVIIDEVQTITSMISNQSKNGLIIYNMLKNAKNIKIVFLSATPIINKPFELAILMNMLKGVMVVSRFIIGKTDIKKIDTYVKEIEKLEFVKYCEPNYKLRYFDLLLTYPNWNPNYIKAIENLIIIGKKYDIEITHKPKEDLKYTLFPETEDEFNETFILSNASGIDTVRRKEILRRRLVGFISYYKGGDKKKYPKQNPTQFITTEMSDYQFVQYAAIRYFEKKVEKGGATGSINLKRKKAQTTSSSMYRIYSRQLSNFVFPEEISKPFLKKEMENKFKSKLSGNYKNNKNDNKNIKNALLAEKKASDGESDLNLKKLQQTQSLQRITETLTAMKDNKEKYLSYDDGMLDKLSPKMKAIYGNIRECKGIALVYSQFVTLEGLGIFSILLEANGYEKLNSSNSETKSRKYCMYTGNQPLEERKEILKIMTKSSNKYGEICQLILISESGAQGINLKNIRQVHIMEPFWNEVRIQQIIGRAVRYESHIELPPSDRDVDVFRYSSVFTDKQQKEFIGMFAGPISTREKTTTDEYIYDLSVKKEKLTDEILTVMKESAIDCKLNKLFNEKDITCLDLGKETGMAYYPDLKRDYLHTKTDEKKIDLKTTFKGKKGILLTTGLVIFKGKGSQQYQIFQKKKFQDYVPNTKITKKDVEKQVIFDTKTQSIFDYDIYVDEKRLEDLGELGKEGKVI
jgi:hypothetical protein